MRTGYLQGEATWSRLAGPAARLELGLHPRPGLGVFGFGEVFPGDQRAGLGVRWQFDL